MATEVQWIVTLAYPIGMLVLEQILIAGVKLGPKITLDVIEEMLDVENAKEVVRNIYTNIALVSALLLTVTFAMLQADRPSCESCDPRLILESLYITATWTACLCHIRVTLECVINLVYTESLPHYMVLRYLIAFPGSVGGPVIALSMAVVNMLFSAAVWLTMEYSAAAGVGFGVMSVFYVIFLSILARVKSNFSATRGTPGAARWEWVEKEPGSVNLNSITTGSAALFRHSKKTQEFLYKRGQQAKQLEDAAPKAKEAVAASADRPRKPNQIGPEA